jgi:hypothetical protein
MRTDIMMTWRNDKPPGPSLFQDLRSVGGYDITRNGNTKVGEVVFFTAYATVNLSAANTRQLADDLYTKYDLDIVELTWNPPDFLWAVAEWCMEHRFNKCVDTFNNIIEAVSNRFLRGDGPYTDQASVVQKES